jgi:GntR family transcriptional regulator
LNEPVTIVRQIRDGFRELIVTRGLAPGDRIPTEAELSSLYGASRPAVREALKLLEQDGVVRVEHGRGRFLSAAGALHVERPITCFESVTVMVRGEGYEATSRVLSVGEEPAGADVADGLQCDPGTPVVRLERLRLHEGLPILYSLDYVPRRLLPGRVYDIDWSGSLLELLARHDARPVMSSATASAVFLPEDVQARYGLQDFGPSFLIVETCHSDDGSPVVFAKDYHRGESFSFRFLRK